MNHVRPSILAAMVLTLLAALYVGVAHAATGTSQTTWTNPSQYTDGTTMAPADITGYKFICTFTPTGASSGVPCSNLAPAQISTGAQTAATTSFTYPATGGTACYQVVVSTATNEADPSAITAQSCKVFAALKPKPVTGVTITVTISVNLPAGVTLETLTDQAAARGIR